MAIYELFKRSILLSAICMVGASPALSQDSSSDSLDEVVVKSQRQPYRGDTPLESLPQAVQILPSEMLNEMGIVSFQDALDLSASVARQNNFGGIWDMFAVRGLAGDENNSAGYLVNGFSAGRGYSGRRDTSNVESIEIMKGPGSALYGRSEPGGTINLITKKPQFEREGYVKATFGRWSTARLEGDYTDAASDTVAFRINGAYEQSDSFRGTEPEKLAITPSVLFTIGDRTSLLYELEYVTQEVLFDRGVISLNGDPFVLPPERFLGDPRLGPMEIDSLSHQFTLQHELTDDWSMLAGLGYRDSSFEGNSADISLSAARNLFLVDGVTVARQLRYRNYQAQDLSGRLEFTGTIDAGITHHLLVGADAYEYEHDVQQARWRVTPGDYDYTINAFDPDYDAWPIPQTTPNASTLEEQSSFGIYFQDVMDLTDRLKLLVGLRYDDFDQTITNRFSSAVSSVNPTETSYRAGLVFEPTTNVSLYASYAEGFRPNTGADFQGRAFEPEDSESSEIGVKWTSTDGDLSGSVTLFQAKKSNVLTADPINAGFSAELGEAESEGVEIDLAGNITDDLSIFFSYAYIDAVQANGIINADWGVFVPAGTPLINVADHTANLSLSKGFTLRGSDASAGFAVRYVGDRLGETIDPTYVLPSFTLLNLFGTYQPTDNLRFAVHVDNVTDKEYIESSYHKWWNMPGSPRTYSVSLQYSYY
ncbi:MAG TPA: TonB-dependent siderophore receptor [Woeseiaceae bacterium]|nr:TonB-dependent siderophore receptor [Woeseiaceae bacterium]